MAWAWLGLIEYSGADEIVLPDLEIGIGTFDFENPVPGSAVSMANISADTPLELDWTPYSDDTDIEYWADILEDTIAQEPVWQSALDADSSADWDGITGDGTMVEPGDYLRGVGAIIPLEDGYVLTIFSRLAALELIE